MAKNGRSTLRRRATLLAVFAALVSCSAAAAASTAAVKPLQVTPVGRLPFPERGYVVDLPQNAAAGHGDVHVTENGKPVGSFSFAPLASTGLRYGAVLAIDSSLSMKGAPFLGALAAAKKFGSHRGANERIGLVAFNGSVKTVVAPTLSHGALTSALLHPPALAYGTRIYDALNRSLALLASQKVTTGAIILLSDGADVGSRATLARVVARAHGQNIRIFTVGLRSKAFAPTTLGQIASQTGGAYAEAAAAAQLTTIYAALGQRLAGEYLLQYHSNAAPTSHVSVQISVDGVGRTASAYTAPTPSGLPPFHRSLVTRFFLSPISLVLLVLLAAGLMALALRSMLESGRTRLVERVNAFVESPRHERLPAQVRRRTLHARTAGAEAARGWLASLQHDLEIADMDVSATRVAGYTIGGTALVFILLALVSPIVALLALLIPFISRGIVKRKLKKVRDDFADQLPPNLQVLASALRSGHSFSGALATVVENAHEPSRRELMRAVTDEQLGVYMEDAVNRVAARMANRDLEQVALLAELQRTTGGNAAEVLDTVVATIRERAEIRRLVHTLTAQGRMARWILTALPIVTGLAFYSIQPDVMKPMLHATGGQFALVFAGFMVAAGSMIIQRIIDIKV
jgi:tight adherence protein B